MGTILSVQTVQMPTFPILSADQAYLESEKNADLNNKLDQEIKNTNVYNYERFNILHAQAYEDCKVRVMVAMLLGNYHVRVNWKPKTT